MEENRKNQPEIAIRIENHSRVCCRPVVLSEEHGKINHAAQTTALKRSSLGLDLYLWLVYRTFTLRATLRLSWRQVYRQFGAHPAKASNNNTVQAFRYKILRELKKIKPENRTPEIASAEGRVKALGTSCASLRPYG